MGKSILMISKPVCPPWNDSSKNLVKDLATAGSRYTYRLLTADGFRLAAEGTISEPLYKNGGRFTPQLAQNLRVMGRLARRDDAILTHFFFAPNAVASAAARAALFVRKRLTVQTVCSTPVSYRHAERLLFAKRVVVLSRDTHGRFVRAGIDPDRLVVIPPGIHLPPVPDAAARARARRHLGIPRDRPAVIYPGDYQFSHAARNIARAIPLLGDTPATFIFACRVKQPASLRVEQSIRRMLSRRGVEHRVQFLGEVDDMPTLLSACDLCLMPAESLYAKMDLPLVLLEAMALGVPLVVSDRPPLSELLHDGAAAAVAPGDPDALAWVLRTLLGQPARLKEMGARARAAACDRYDIRRVSGRYEALYDDLIQRYGGH